MRITLVAAVARNGVIGADGGMPWHLPEDLQHFKALTTGHPVVMGRRTFESIGRALPGRRTIVVTGQPGWSAAGVETAPSVAAALALAGWTAAAAADDETGGTTRGATGTDGSADTVMVAGGGDVYRQTMELADELEITHLRSSVPGDTRFPEIDPTRWIEAARDDRGPFVFVRYVRRPAGERRGDDVVS
jgi:dihydrofolate reductase